MPRPSRPSTRSASRASKTLPKRTTRNSLSTVQEQSSDEDDDSIPPVAPPKRSKPTIPALGRLTRSRITAADYAEFKEIPAVKKRRSTKVQKKPPKRQRVETILDSQEEERQSGAEDGEDDESAPQIPDFYKNINKVVLPERDEAQDGDGAVGDPGGRVADPEAEIHEIERSDEEDLQKRPTTSTLRGKPPQPGRQGPRRKQRQKTPVGESVYDLPGASPELGSRFMESPSKPREPVVRSPQGNLPDEGWYDAGAEDDSSSQAAEPETTDEPAPDASTEMVTADSVNAEPTGKTEVNTTEVSSEWVGNLIQRMQYGGWTGDKDWENDFVVQVGETKPHWLKRHEDFLRPEKCKNLFTHLNNLRELCHDMPKATDIEDQSKYRLEKNDFFQKSFTTIESLVTYICKRISDQMLPDTDRKVKWGNPAVKTLHEKIIPMLLVVLKESFLAGGALTFDKEKKSDLNEGCFTSSTLTLPLKVVGWVSRLYEVGTQYLDQFPPKPLSDSEAAAKKIRSANLQRGWLRKPLTNMQTALEKAKGRLDYLASAPQRKKEIMERRLQMQKKLERDRQEKRKRREKDRQEAMEMDQVLREERERMELEERKAQDLQMQLFVGSIQRMRAPKANEANEVSARDAYYSKHGGWYQWEDERLLQMIRTVEEPDLRALTPLVPERSVDEVAQRVRDLKERVRAKYEAAELVPPAWCY
ncbi:hypothetical protein QQZ08_006929 [Neonectria magnoliae]|uniref:Uncharacterized protein n=1 Tax=Neonectria magnoliae TaxID=2732573 RepID=A0ABR1I025_9HYPO